MYLGDINSEFANTPIVGSDYITTGFTPASMHVDPVTGVDYYDEAAAAQAAAIAAATPQGPSFASIAIWLAALGAAGYYAYREGWLQKLGAVLK